MKPEVIEKALQLISISPGFLHLSRETGAVLTSKGLEALGTLRGHPWPNTWERSHNRWVPTP
jgi:hypothetical protein